MFTLAPPSLAMVLKPWRNELRRGGKFFFQLIKPCSVSINKPLPAHNSLQQNQAFFQTPKQGQFHVPKPVALLGASSVVQLMSQTLSLCSDQYVFELPSPHRLGAAFSLISDCKMNTVGRRFTYQALRVVLQPISRNRQQRCFKIL